MAFYCTLAARVSSGGEKCHKNVNFICLSSLFHLVKLSSSLKRIHGDIFRVEMDFRNERSWVKKEIKFFYTFFVEKKILSAFLVQWFSNDVLSQIFFSFQELKIMLFVIFKRFTKVEGASKKLKAEKFLRRKSSRNTASRHVKKLSVADAKKTRRKTRFGSLDMWRLLYDV